MLFRSIIYVTKDLTPGFFFIDNTKLNSKKRLTKSCENMKLLRSTLNIVLFLAPSANTSNAAPNSNGMVYLKINT
jgi:hypothetical protein